MTRPAEGPAFPPKPDREMVARFAAIVFGYTEGYVAVRILREKGSKEAKPWTEILPADATLGANLAGLAGRAAADGRALFVVPGTLARPGRATAETLVVTAVVLVDLDSGDIVAKRAHLEHHLGAATLVVASGGTTDAGQHKLHLYWRLTEAASGPDLKRVAALRETIARKAGGDASVARLHQPIRVAGSLHQKHGKRSLCRIIREAGRDHDLDELAEAVEAMPAMHLADAPARPRVANGPGATALMTTTVRENGADGITRFDAVSKVIGHWIRQVRSGRIDLAGARRAIQEHNAAMIVPPWSEDRLRQDFERLLARDIAANGPMPFGDNPNTPNGAAVLPAPPTHSEDALADDFVRTRGAEWRHVPVWGRWLRWTGTHWQEDDTSALRDAVRHVCRAAAVDSEAAGAAKRLASDRTIRAVMAIAGADQRIARGVSIWDAAPDLLNTPAGIIDLTSGELCPHDRARHLTQITSAAPGTGCRLWLRFLDEITAGDPALEAYLQRLAGYCLTGSTQEQTFFFLHGHGANGKSVFLQTLAAVLGSYARTAPVETFMASRSPGHPTDLAGLRGARLVLVTETEANRAWAESRIKTITGGDPIAARFMHRDFFEFVPTFKLVVAGNHRPQLAGVGEAMRRRLHLVPFEVTIPEERRDHRLSEKLLAERDRILGWMIEGSVEWRRVGLAPPERVLAASRDYFADEDLVGQWIAEHCSVGPARSAPAAALFASWSAFAEAGGFEKGSRRSLADALAARGFQPVRNRRERGWKGVGLGTIRGSEE